MVELHCVQEAIKIIILALIVVEQRANIFLIISNLLLHLIKDFFSSGFWSFVKVHLGKLEEERFLSLQKATSDAGRGL